MERFNEEYFLARISECENVCNPECLKELIANEHGYVRANVLDLEDGRIVLADTKVGERMRKIIQVCNSHLDWYETFLGKLCKSDIRLVRCLCAGAVDMNRTEFFEEEDFWVRNVWLARHEFVDWYYNISGRNPISAASKEMIDWIAERIVDPVESKMKVNSSDSEETNDSISIRVNWCSADGLEMIGISELLKGGSTILPMNPNYYFISDKKTLAWMLNKLREQKFVEFKEGVLPEYFNEPMTEPYPFASEEEFPRCFGTMCPAWTKKRSIRGPHIRNN